jgi:hypothetical protein
MMNDDGPDDDSLPFHITTSLLGLSFINCNGFLAHE